MAKDKELNKWCSLKKTVQHRPAHVEANEVKIYAERGQKIHLKKKILPSLFTEEDLEATQIPSTKSNETDIEVNHNSNTKKKPKKNLLVKEEQDPGCEENDSNKTEVDKKTKRKGKIAKPSNTVTLESENEKLESSVLIQEPHNEKETQNKSHSDALSPQKGKKNKKKRRKQESTELSNDQHSMEISNENKKRKKSNQKNDNNPAKKRKTEFNKSTDIGISDARLQAYGLNPKKFKNKLKYKK